jgi:hypothetical protein
MQRRVPACISNDQSIDPAFCSSAPLIVGSFIYAAALLGADDADVPLDRGVSARNLEAEVADDAELYLGLRGDVSVDARAAEDEDDEAAEVMGLRKTRAGGNWLMGGIMLG